jgi:hypothetical protein
MASIGVSGGVDCSPEACEKPWTGKKAVIAIMEIRTRTFRNLIMVSAEGLYLFGKRIVV